MKITRRQLKRIIRENRSQQEIATLVTGRIKDVGFGDENEEDFKYVKIELEEDGLASEDELDQLTFDQWKELKESKAMKIKLSKLRRIIKEQLEFIAQDQQPEVQKQDKEVSEVGMSVNQLQAAAATALELSDLIREMDHVPEWAQGKIAVLLNNLNDIRGYMVGKNIGQEES